MLSSSQSQYFSSVANNIFIVMSLVGEEQYRQDRMKTSGDGWNHESTLEKAHSIVLFENTKSRDVFIRHGPHESVCCTLEQYRVANICEDTRFTHCCHLHWSIVVSLSSLSCLIVGVRLGQYWQKGWLYLVMVGIMTALWGKAASHCPV